MRRVRTIIMAAAVAGVTVVAVAPAIAYAALTADSSLTQTITAGTLSTSIRDVGGSLVASPSFAMTSATVSNSEQTSTGVFGTNSQRITVDNPGAANDGWTLSLNATAPSTALWESSSHSYHYNYASSQGLLTVDPSIGTYTAVAGGSTGITLGSSAWYTIFNQPITILSASASAADISNGYLTGVGLSQTIPASQPAGNYSLDMTQTITAT